MNISAVCNFLEQEVGGRLKSLKEAIYNLPVTIFNKLYPSEPTLFVHGEDKSQKLNMDKHFSKSYVINLASASQKIEVIQEHLEEIGTKNWERFDAVNGYRLADDHIIEGTNVTFKEFYSRMPGKSEKHKRARAGCYLSHLFAVKKAKAEGLESIHIQEDDAVYPQNKQTVESFENMMKEVPENWDMLFLGFEHDIKPRQISKHVDETTSGNCMHSYVVRKRCFDRLIADLQRPITDKSDEVLPVDEVISEHLERRNYRAYSPHELIGFQRDGLKSDITGNVNADYSLFRKYVQRTYSRVLAPILTPIGLPKYQIYKTAAKVGRFFNLSY